MHHGVRHGGMFARAGVRPPFGRSATPSANPIGHAVKATPELGADSPLRLEGVAADQRRPDRRNRGGLDFRRQRSARVGKASGAAGDREDHMLPRGLANADPRSRRGSSQRQRSRRWPPVNVAVPSRPNVFAPVGVKVMSKLYVPLPRWENRAVPRRSPPQARSAVVIPEPLPFSEGDPCLPACLWRPPARRR